MARRSPLKDPVVNQKYETGCTWRMFRIFNFREGHSNRRLVSNRRHLNTLATAAGNGNTRNSSDVLRTVDEKCPHIGVSSRRRRDYSCKSISCVENDQVADGRNEATKIVDQKFVSKNYQGEDVAGCQPNQFLDALQILYSNKELFRTLLQDPNSLLVKQIHGLQSPQVKEPYQARQKKMTRLNKFQSTKDRQCEKPLESFDKYYSSSTSEPQSSNRIAVLTPDRINVQNFADTSFDCPVPHSPTSFSYDVRNIKPSHFPFGCIKRKFRHVMRVRRKEQQWRTTDEVPHKFPCGCQAWKDGKNARELDIVGRNSQNKVHSSIENGSNSSLDLKKRDRIIKVKDSELCIGQEAASFGESCCRNRDNTSVRPSKKNTLNIHVECRKNLSGMLNSGIEESRQRTNTQGRKIPLPDFGSLPSLRRYWQHSSVTEEMRYFPYSNYQMFLSTKLGLQKEEENSSFSSLGRNIKDPPRAIVRTPSVELLPFGADISIRKSPPGDNLHAQYGISRAGCEKPIESSYDVHKREIRYKDAFSEPDGEYKDSPTQNFGINNSTGGIGSFLDSDAEKPEVASSSPSSCQRIEDTLKMRNRIEHPSVESAVEQFNEENVTNPPTPIFQTDESPVQAVHDRLEEHHFADHITSSLDPIKDLTSSTGFLDYIREILQAFTQKWDELVMKCETSDQLLDPSTFDELKGLTHQLCGSTILFDCVIEALMEVYKNCGFLLHISTKKPNVQAHVVEKILVKEITELVKLHFLPHPSPITLEQLVEKDLARRGSWLNIQVDTEDITIEVVEDVLEELILETESEMDIRRMIHCNM